MYILSCGFLPFLHSYVQLPLCVNHWHPLPHQILTPEFLSLPGRPTSSLLPAWLLASRLFIKLLRCLRQVRQNTATASHSMNKYPVTLNLRCKSVFWMYPLGSTTLYFVWLWFSVMISTCCKERFPWWGEYYTYLIMGGHKDKWL